MGFIYSTNKSIDFDKEEIEGTLPNDKQILKLRIEKKGRGGKTATIINNFIGSKESLKELSKEIKTFCSTGGSIKDNEIIIQGDLKSKIKVFLENKGYKTKG